MSFTVSIFALSFRIYNKQYRVRDHVFIITREVYHFFSGGKLCYNITVYHMFGPKTVLGHHGGVERKYAFSSESFHKHFNDFD